MLGWGTERRSSTLDKPRTQHRLPHLDGLRGLAIAAVVLYHCYSRWPDIPRFYTSAFDRGYLGVQLFFLLSGFLIFLSLETSRSLGNFLFRRWLRLFPAMLAVTCLVYVTTMYLYNRVEALPGYLDPLPGLLFIEPHWLRDILHLKVTGPLEGDFWTLFTEVKFYVIFGLAFFLIGRRAVHLLALLGIFGAVVYLLRSQGMLLGPSGIDRALGAVCDEINCRFYGWFAAGAYFYLFFETRKRGYLVASALCAAVGVVANASLGDPLDVAIVASVYAIFAAPFFWAPLGSLFSSRVMVFLGFISYPLYLVHENASWALIRRLGDACPAIPARLVPVLPILLVGFVAWLIAAYIEPLGRQMIGMARRTRPATPPLFGDGRAEACASLAVIAAVAVSLGLTKPVRDARLATEAHVISAEGSVLEPLQRKLSESRLALEGVRQARLQAQAYLESMPKANP